MIFLSGPRQVGKTTTSLEASSESSLLHYYFNWDNEDHRALVIEGPQAVARKARLDEAGQALPI